MSQESRSKIDAGKGIYPANRRRAQGTGR